MMKKWLKRFKENEKGLTLVELLAVIVILAIVGAIAFVAVGNVIDNSKKDAHVANAMQVISAAELYEASGGVIGSGTDEVNTATGLQAVNVGTLGDLVDPWQGETGKEQSSYDFTIKKGSNGIEVSSTHGQCTFTDQDKGELSEGRKVCTTPGT